ncbi:hypothetical protein RQN9TF_29090 [Rhodococcus qingshengii]|uniref:hypothetical protein n=1 Tax=Rhodococcus TaxID=1827 RepID=UPI001F154AE8|nr:MULTISPECIES: hypothetical protein [Rhodococcus]BDQ23299.1 hypothetical protein RQN9TF_29090 [Rhodococcus qingshengii]
MFLSDQSIRHHTRRFGAALSPSHKWPPPTETQRIARWSERSEMLGALSVLLFWAFGFGILLGVGALTTGIFALRRHPKKSGGHLLSNARQLPWDAIVGLFTGFIGLALSGWFFVVVLPNM